MAESGRRYDAADLALAAEPARRAATAIDNARLFRDAACARAEAEAANRAKSQFLATMSHELRTPLNAIGGYAELMEMEIRGPITGEQRDDLARIQRSQKHLLGLINEVLNYARIESGSVRYDIAEVGVIGAIMGIESLVLPQIRAKGLRLEIHRCDPSVAVLADAEKLRQVLLNLLTNAIKFTPEGGEITLECRVPGSDARVAHDARVRGGIAASGERDVVEIVVSDTGIGIAPDQLDQIFQPFVQVGRALNDPGAGTGLGLAISRDLARGMGGELAAESRPAVGSSFALILPRYLVRGGATKRRDCRSYACASASTRASAPGSPTIDTLSAGIPSAPSPAGTETSGKPSQLP